MRKGKQVFRLLSTASEAVTTTTNNPNAVTTNVQTTTRRRKKGTSIFSRVNAFIVGFGITTAAAAYQLDCDITEVSRVQKYPESSD